jgi:hypothetical protein
MFPYCTKTNYGRLVQALKDYDYMIHRSQLPDDPFIATGVRTEDDKILRTAMEKYEAKLRGTDLGQPLPTWPWEKDDKVIGNTRYINVRSLWLLNFWRRLGVVFIVGGLLLAPMWIMVWKQDTWVDLKITTAFVVGFGFLTALFVDRLMDVLASVAAYTAVLVVFVGAIANGPNRNS